MARKTTLTSRNQFRTQATALSVKLNGVPMLADIKEFSTGSLGWYANGKLTVEVKGQALPAMPVEIAGVPMVASPRDGDNKFSTGSCGWYLNGKTTVVLKDGTPVEVQVGLTLTIVKSKDTGVNYGGLNTVQVGLNLTCIDSKSLAKDVA